MLNQLDDPEGKIGLQPINMRVLNGVNLDELKIKKTQGKYINFDSYNIETPEGLERARGDAMKFWEGLSKSQIG